MTINLRHVVLTLVAAALCVAPASAGGIGNFSGRFNRSNSNANFAPKNNFSAKTLSSGGLNSGLKNFQSNSAGKLNGSFNSQKLNSQHLGTSGGQNGGVFKKQFNPNTQWTNNAGKLNSGSLFGKSGKIDQRITTPALDKQTLPWTSKLGDIKTGPVLDKNSAPWSGKLSDKVGKFGTSIDPVGNKSPNWPYDKIGQIPVKDKIGVPFPNIPPIFDPGTGGGNGGGGNNPPGGGNGGGGGGNNPPGGGNGGGNGPGNGNGGGGGHHGKHHKGWWVPYLVGTLAQPRYYPNYYYGGGYGGGAPVYVSPTYSNTTVMSSQPVTSDPIVMAVDPVETNSGVALLVRGQSFGSQAGHVVMKFGSVQVFLDVIEWAPASVTVEMPKVQVAEGTSPQIVLIRADGTASRPFDPAQ